MHVVTRDIWEHAQFRYVRLDDLVKLSSSVKLYVKARPTNLEAAVMVELHIVDKERADLNIITFAFDKPLPVTMIPNGLIDLRSFLPEFVPSEIWRLGIEALITLNGNLILSLHRPEDDKQKDDERRVSIELDLTSATSNETPWMGLTSTTFGKLNELFRIDDED